MPAPTHILIVRLSHLGDVVHALPVYEAVRAAHPTARVGWVVQPEFADLVRELPGLAACVEFERRGGAGAWLRLRERLAAFGADWVIDAQGNWKSAVVCLASGAPRRTGLARRDWRERSASLVTNERAPRCTSGPHAVDRMLGLARFVAPRVEVPPAPTFPVAPAELAAGERELDARVPGPGAPLVVAVGREGDPRTWPEASLARCVERLADAGATVLVVSGPGEREAGERLAARIARPGVAHWIGQRGLASLAGLYAAAARRGGRLLAGDSGPAHLAAAVGLPVVSLAGPQDAARTGPWPPPGATSPHRVLRAREEPACAPCFARSCANPSGLVCMEGIDPERVATEMLRGTRDKA